MRVAGNIPHPRLKITLFSLDDRWTVQVEDGPVEQTFKYRKEDFPSLEAVKALFDQEVLSEVEKGLAGMKKILRRQLSPPPPEDDAFPVII